MSRVFKILVDIIIVACLLAVAALLVPSLCGVETDVAGPKMDKNIAEGSVAYGVRRPAVTLNEGDEILYSDENSLYVYTVNEVDADNGEVYVTDPTTSDQLVLQMNRNATKKVLIIPYLGYGLIALYSKNGLALLISGAAVLAALFILAAVWDKRRKDRKAAQHDEDDEYFTALAQSVDKPNKLDEVLYRPNPVQPEAEGEFTADAPTIAIPSVGETGEAAANEQAAAAAAAVTAIAGMQTRALYDNREEEETLEAAEEAEAVAAETAATAAEAAPEVTAAAEERKKAEEKAAAAVKETKKAAKEEVQEKAAAPAAEKKAAEKPAQPAAAREAVQQKAEERFNTDSISAAFAEIPDDHSPASLNISDNEIPDVSDALVAALETTQVSRADRTYQTVRRPAEPEPAEEELDEIELAIPVRTANEILDDAYAKGYDPQVIKDEVTGVKLVDFSDCF